MPVLDDPPAALFSSTLRIQGLSPAAKVSAGSSSTGGHGNGIHTAACASPAALAFWPAGREVAVSRKAAEGILRGAHVFVPGERLQHCTVLQCPSHSCAGLCPNTASR